MGEVFQQTVEYIDPKEAGLELWSVTVENGLTPKSERYNREFLVKKNDKFKAIHPDEIVYNPMNMTLGSIGFNNSGKDVAVSGYYVTMKLNEGFDTKYFATWLPSPNAINLYKLYATGSLIERQRVQFPTLSGIKTLMPSLNEQKQIGLFFKQLDTTTALHQQKLDQLKRLKQGLLQVLFANKEQVPKVRFAGFDEEWEQRKLGGIFKKYTQKNKDLEFHSDSVISVAKMKLSPPSAKSSDEYMKTYNKIWKGNIAFEGHTNDEFPNGRFVLNDCQNGIVSHIYDVYSAVDEYNNEFMKRYINNPDVMRKILINATSSARMMKSLNSIEFLKQSILLPILSEQQKIGSFFKQLDDAIALHQTKLEKLKQLKKAFLQKMFI